MDDMRAKPTCDAMVFVAVLELSFRTWNALYSSATRALVLGERLPMIGGLLSYRQSHGTALCAHVAGDSADAVAVRMPGSVGAPRIDIPPALPPPHDSMPAYNGLWFTAPELAVPLIRTPA